MTAYEIELASLTVRAVSAFIAAGSLVAILVGLRQMRQSTEVRSKREDARHAESMAALQALIRGMETVIERTAPKP